MTTPDEQAMREFAENCVRLVAEQYGRRLDWSQESLTELDLACASLLEDGPLSGARLDLWWKLIGGYTGEVVVRLYDGRWVSHERSPGAPGVLALGVTAFPFATANKLLTGEEGKSLASFARAVPVIAEHSQRSD
jgi:hypothetical protein